MIKFLASIPDVKRLSSFLMINCILWVMLHINIAITFSANLNIKSLSHISHILSAVAIEEAIRKESSWRVISFYYFILWHHRTAFVSSSALMTQGVSFQYEMFFAKVSALIRKPLITIGCWDQLKNVASFLPFCAELQIYTITMFYLSIFPPFLSASKQAKKHLGKP